MPSHPAFLAFPPFPALVYSEYGQATKRPFLNWSGGMASAQSGFAIGQRVRNGQPDGLLMGDGMSPTSFAWRMRRTLGSGRGAEASRAREYGCSGD